MSKLKSLSLKKTNEYFQSLKDSEKDSWDNLLGEILSGELENYVNKNGLIIKYKDFCFVKGDMKNEESSVFLALKYYNIDIDMWFSRNGVCQIVADCFEVYDENTALEEGFKEDYTTFENFMNDVLERVDKHKRIDKSKKASDIEKENNIEKAKKEHSSNKSYGKIFITIGVIMLVLTVLFALKSNGRNPNFYITGIGALLSLTFGIYEMVIYIKEKKSMDGKDDKNSSEK